MIEPEILDKLRSITARTGLSKSEQIREGIRWWLASREWPLRNYVVGHGLDERQPPGAEGVRRTRKPRGK